MFLTFIALSALAAVASAVQIQPQPATGRTVHVPLIKNEQRQPVHLSRALVDELRVRWRRLVARRVYLCLPVCLCVCMCICACMGVVVCRACMLTCRVCGRVCCVVVAGRCAPRCSAPFFFCCALFCTFCLTRSVAVRAQAAGETNVECGSALGATHTIPVSCRHVWLVSSHRSLWTLLLINFVLFLFVQIASFEDAQF